MRRDRPESPGGRRVYRIFGLAVASNVRLHTPLPRTGRAADLEFRCSTSPPLDRDPPVGEPIFTHGRLESGVPRLALFRGPGFDLMRFSEVADFYVADDRIDCHLLDPEYGFMVEIHLLGAVFSFFFERRGVPMLHASAVSVRDRAVLFLATNRGGKSSLAASLMQAGYPLLSDDLVGIQRPDRVFEARPGYPCMRLWPDQAEHFHGTAAGLALAHPRFEKRRLPVGRQGFGRFSGVPRGIAAVYLPDRRPTREGGGSVEIVPLRPRQATIELIRNSFLPRIVEAIGLAPARLASLAALADSVPVNRLSYPDGMEFLTGVRDRILDDLRARRAAAAATP